jgi:NAD(P)-dependent dehydrogenase (short-subunit alcohol dehydrogenase family)
MNKSNSNISDPLFDINGRTFIIGGGGGELAIFIAKELSSRGANLVIFDINQESLDLVNSEIPSAITKIVDINDEQAITDAMSLAKEKFGSIDGALNTASILKIAPALELDEALFRKTMDINLTGAFLFSRVAARAMQDTGGRIVHIASVSSYVSNLEYAAYASSKAAVAQLIKVLAREWAPNNILINAIGPALIDTAMTRKYLSDPNFLKNALSMIPMGRLGQPEELIGTVLLLLGRGGAFITGQTIYVDGGRTLV